jgi:hypothetical protein
MRRPIANGRLDRPRPKTDRQKSSKTDKFTCLSLGYPLLNPSVHGKPESSLGFPLLLRLVSRWMVLEEKPQDQGIDSVGAPKWVDTSIHTNCSKFRDHQLNAEGFQSQLERGRRFVTSSATDGVRQLSSAHRQRRSAVRSVQDWFWTSRSDRTSAGPEC